MPIADTKKCQTLINVIGQEAQAIQIAVAAIKAMRTKFQANDPDVTGTALEGNIAAANTWIDQLDTVANAAVANGFIANISPTHRNTALED